MIFPSLDRVYLGLAGLGAGTLALCACLLLWTILKRTGRRRLIGLLGPVDGRGERGLTPSWPLVDLLVQAGLSPSRRLAWALLVLTAGGGGLAGAVLVGSPYGGLPGVLLPVLLLGSHARRRLAARSHQARQRLPDALQALASSLRSGQSLAQAVEALGTGTEGPLAEVFRRVAEEYRAGTPLLRALRRLEESFPGDDVSYFLQALEIHRFSGGNLAEVLANGAAALNERRALWGDLHARTAEARLSARILLALPVCLGLYFWWGNREMLRPLWETGAGRVGAGYAVCSWLAGRELMTRLIASIKP
ncbi:MAG: type II secretion system F family protein [bacterium]|nr:type II secretion system F family protein [bacterium]